MGKVGVNMNQIPANTNENLEVKNIILLLAISIYSVGIFTSETFVSSYNIKMIYIVVTIFTFLIYYVLSKRRITIYIVELMWLLFFLYFILHFIFQGNIKSIFVVDIVVFSTLVILLALMKVNIQYYKVALNIMLLFAIIHALGSLFQFLNMELYSRVVLSRFSGIYQSEILRIYRNSSYTGFTRQSAYISGFLVLGIAISFYMINHYKNKVLRTIVIICLPLLLFSLFLGGKRAHLIFMAIAFLVTYLFSTNLKNFFLQIIKLTSLFILFIISILIIYFSYTPNSTSQFGKIYIKFDNTIQGLISGEDITSGRVELYDYALELFKDNPITGIGWRMFNELTFGFLSSTSGSHPHNIYIQLLTELGIVGFILFIIPVIYVLIKTIKLLMSSEKILNNGDLWKSTLQFSLFTQTFFILYGFTGNLLTDHMYILIYVFAVSITLSAMKYSIKSTINLRRDEKG